VYAAPEQLERLNTIAAGCPLRRWIEAGIEFVERLECRRPALVGVGREPTGPPIVAMEALLL
jgi:hypothetical protein